MRKRRSQIEALESRFHLDSIPYHLQLAEQMVENIAPANNVYAYGTPTVTWAGLNGGTAYVNQSDCSTFNTALLTTAYHFTSAQFTQWTGYSSPQAKDYYNAAVADDGFDGFTNVANIQPGDDLFIKFVDPTTDTGHVATIVSAPTLVSTSATQLAYNLTVIDCADSPHSNDTRTGSQTGVGEGVIRIYTDLSGNLVSYAWSTSPNSTIETSASALAIFASIPVPTITVSPASPSVAAASTTQFSAIEFEQSGVELPTQPNFEWSIVSGGGSIDNTGLFTAPSTGGTTTVEASDGSYTGTATVTTLPSAGIFTSDADIGSPSLAGSASYAPSSGTSGGTYSVTGAGNDIWSTSDQFNYLYKSYNGNGAIIARVTTTQNTNGASKAAVMFRDSTAAGDAFVDVVVTYSDGIGLQYRTASGQSAAEGPSYSGTAPIWIKLARTGSSFTGYYSTSTSTPSTWTSIGTISAPGIANDALAGLAVTSHNTAKTDTSTFTNVQITGTDAAPVVVVGAATSAATIPVGSSVNLSVLGTDDAGASALTYTWSATPSSGVSFTANASNAAANTTATFTSPGLYSLLVTLSNGTGLTATSTVNVNVLPSWLSATSIASWNPSTHILTVSGPATIVADPGADEPIIEASGNSAAIALDPSSGSDIHIGGLSLSDGATATVTSLGSARTITNYHVLVLGTASAIAAPLFSIDSTSKLDLADNDLAVLYGSGSSPLSAIAADISEAYDGGAWDEPGLTSSIAKTSGGVTALGYGEASALGLSSFDGVTLGANAVLVKYTLVGDTELRGTVGIGDYDTVLNNFGTAQGWTGGDFHYGGTVGISDYNAVAGAYGDTLASVLAASDSEALKSNAAAISKQVAATAQATATGSVAVAKARVHRSGNSR